MKKFVLIAILAILASATQTFAQGGPLVISGLTAKNPTCPGTSTGEASVTASGGFQPYIYLWSNGANTASVNNLSAGPYIVTIKDSIGQSATAGFSLADPKPIQVITTTTPAGGCGSSVQGKIFVTTSGGTGPYTLSFSTAPQPCIPSPSFSCDADWYGAPGTYTVTVTDANGCTATTSATVGSTGGSTGVTITATTSGSTATLTASLGTSYSWSNGGTTQAINPITTGTYTVTVTNNSCVGTASATFVKPDCPPSSPTGNFIFANNGKNWLPIGTGADACVGETVRLTVTEGTAQTRTYLWKPSGKKYFYDDVTFTTPGVFVFICDVTNPGTWPNPSTTNTYYFTVNVVNCLTGPGDEPDGAQQKFGVTVTPNPSAGQFLIEAPAGNYTATVTDATGQVVKTLSGESGDFSLDLSAEPAGIYFLVIQNSDGRGVVEKLVKQ